MSSKIRSFLQREGVIVDTLEREGHPLKHCAGGPYQTRLYQEKHGGKVQIRTSALTSMTVRKKYIYPFWSLNLNDPAPGIGAFIIGLFDRRERLQSVLRVPTGSKAKPYRALLAHRLFHARGFAEILYRRGENHE